MHVVAVRAREVCRITMSTNFQDSHGTHTVCSRGRGARKIPRERSNSGMGNTCEVNTRDLLRYMASSCSDDRVNDRVVDLEGQRYACHRSEAHLHVANGPSCP